MTSSLAKTAGLQFWPYQMGVGMTEPGQSSIEVLTAKLEASQAECARLDRENSELRGRVSAQGAEKGPSEPASLSAPQGAISRRGVLGKALGAAAVTVVGAAVLVDRDARPAAASNGSNVVAGSVTTAEGSTSVRYDGSTDFGGVVLLGNDSTYSGGAAGFPAALGGWAGAGATAGKGGVPTGVYGFTDNGEGYGVVGVNSGLVAGSGAGVFGTAVGAKNIAVKAINTQGTAVSGSSDSTTADATAIIGVITSTGPGGFSSAVRGQNNGTGGLGIGVWGSHNGSGWGMYATSQSGIGVTASGGTGIGVSASGSTAITASGESIGLDALAPTAVTAKGGTVGVDASGPTAIAAAGTTIGVNASGPTAVTATGGAVGVAASGPTAISAEGSTVGVDASGPTGIAANGTNVGLSASGPTGVSVTGTGATGVAVSALAMSDKPAIRATNSGTGAALRGTTGGGSALPGTGALVGDNRVGPGVLGLSATAVGVEGHSHSGRGASFAGGVAQVQLRPGSLSSHPTSGQAGDLYVDSSARLWFCKKGGAHATWKQVA
jgi:hypothetical protein